MLYNGANDLNLGITIVNVGRVSHVLEMNIVVRNECKNMDDVMTILPQLQGPLNYMHILVDGFKYATPSPCISLSERDSKIYTYFGLCEGNRAQTF